MADCAHNWQVAGFGEHFVVEPNSRRRHKPKVLLHCWNCRQRGFRVRGFSRVIYTWDKDQTNWLSEHDNWGQSETVTARLKATQTRQLR